MQPATIHPWQKYLMSLMAFAFTTACVNIIQTQTIVDCLVQRLRHAYQGTVVEHLLVYRNNFGWMPSCCHQRVIWLPVGTEPMLAGTSLPH